MWPNKTGFTKPQFLDSWCALSAASRAGRWPLSWACPALQLWRHTSLGRASSRAPKWVACLSFPLKNKRSTRNTCFQDNNILKREANSEQMWTQGREKLAQFRSRGLGSTLSFFSFQLNSHQHFHRKKGFSLKKVCERINNAPKKVACTPRERGGLNVA